MPVTRSRKGDARRPSQEEESSPLATESSGTVETPPTTTDNTEDTAVEAPIREVRDSAKVIRSSARHDNSVVDQRKRRRETQLRIEISRRELQEAQAAAALARAELELLNLEEEDEADLDSEQDEPEGRGEIVKDWVETTVHGGHGTGDTSTKGLTGGTARFTTLPVPDEVKPKNPLSGDHHYDSSDALASAIMKAISTAPKTGCTSQPAYMQELPNFDGNSGEWIAFRTVYEDTERLFSGAQNMARLRRSIKGPARDAVKSVLYSDCTPEEVMNALRRRFGRPEALVLAEIEKIKNLPRTSENARDVCIFASTVNNVVATVRGLHKPQYLSSPEMIKVIVEKLPVVIRYRWYDFAADHEDPDLSLMAQFLNREADRCGPYAAQETNRRGNPPRQATHTTAEPRETPQTCCPHCEASHSLDECRKFQQATISDRWAIVRRTGLCFRCLKSKHRKETCRRPACRHCKRWHHDLLHEDRRTERSTTERGSTGENAREGTKETANNVQTVNQGQVNATRNTRALLKMVPVVIHGPKGKARVLALLDEGSTVTLIEARVAKEIGLTGPKETLTLETVGGKIIRKDDSMTVNMSLNGLHQKRKRKIQGARTIDDLRLTPQRIDKESLDECAHLQELVDELIYDEESPKLLVGQDNWELIVSRATKRGKNSQPAASLTYLGWVLHGLDGTEARRVNCISRFHAPTHDEELHELVKEHFAIESLGVLPHRPSRDTEERALQILRETTRRLEDGRFEVGMLWKDEEETLPDNYSSALNRLKNIERKLDRDPGLKEEYSEQVNNLLKSGYAEEVTHKSSSNRIWYLPHFAVTHPTKKKKRLVFDAAAKCRGKSLNDALLTGPDLLQSLFGVLIRFREKPIAVVSDIQEMFLQVKIREQDRDSLRFLWRGNERTGTPKEYRMTSVIFGAACSPSLAIYAKNLNAEEHRGDYPDAADAVVKNHYMDDYLHCFNREKDALEIARAVDYVHRKAGFKLRGWASNNETVRRGLTEEVKPEVELGSKEEKTLGLRWFTNEDEMGFRTQLRNLTEVIDQRKTPTKRQVTSAVMSTFDPLGLAAPVLIQGKRLMQDIWRSGKGWDDEITPEDENTWVTYLQDLRLLEELRVPRCVARLTSRGEMHVFTDASEVAYACAIYWRQPDYEGRYQVTLLSGKARVTPLKPVSIPRLELQAAVLGARLAHSIAEEMEARATSITFWTDSSTVLSWIKSDPRTFKPFVAHRLAEIEETTRPQQWRWVSTAHNPADDATRNVPKDFNGGHRWYVGPKFLQKGEEEWPEPRSFKHEPTEEDREAHMTATVRARDYPTPDPVRFSRWPRLLRATARVLQFIDLCRKKKNKKVNVATARDDPTWKKVPKKKREQLYNRPARHEKEEKQFLPLDVTYLDLAEKELLKRSQEESCLKETDKLKKLDVVSEDGLLRIRGRIDAAERLPLDYRRPVILDSKHRIARLLIEHLHEKFNHGNHATVMNEVRQRYWILGLRSAVRATRKNCHWCSVHYRAPPKLPVGDLPRERLEIGAHPFTNTGVDYFGPMTVTIGRRHEKRWGALFTCLTTRAVHIELAASLSTDSMILALRRMAARRGMPKVIFSDNGTNFVGASKELKEAIEGLNSDEFAARVQTQGVRWKFIAPGAPNMGGAWERLVRSIKTALAVTLKERYPKEEVLHTLLLEAEHVVNSRPLLDTDDTEEEGLTPNHFLLGRSCGAPRLGAFTEEDLVGQRSWRTAQRLADHFWARWVREYLPTLLPRRLHGGTTERDMQRGDAVLIVDPTLPRNCWPRGVVTQTYPGPDDRTRVIDVRTAHGTLRRPCTKAVLLVPADTPNVERGQ